MKAQRLTKGDRTKFAGKINRMQRQARLLAGNFIRYSDGQSACELTLKLLDSLKALQASVTNK